MTSLIFLQAMVDLVAVHLEELNHLTEVLVVAAVMVADVLELVLLDKEIMVVLEYGLGILEVVVVLEKQGNETQQEVVMDSQTVISEFLTSGLVAAVALDILILVVMVVMEAVVVEQ